MVHWMIEESDPALWSTGLKKKSALTLQIPLSLDSPLFPCVLRDPTIIAILPTSPSLQGTDSKYQVDFHGPFLEN